MALISMKINPNIYHTEGYLYHHTLWTRKSYLLCGLWPHRILSLNDIFLRELKPHSWEKPVAHCINCGHLVFKGSIFGGFLYLAGKLWQEEPFCTCTFFSKAAEGAPTPRETEALHPSACFIFQASLTEKIRKLQTSSVPPFPHPYFTENLLQFSWESSAHSQGVNGAHHTAASSGLTKSPHSFYIPRRIENVQGRYCEGATTLVHNPKTSFA